MPSGLFRFGEFELDQKAYELRRNGQGVRLERIPFELLNLLVERCGQLVTREEMIGHVWGKGVFHDTEHGINTAVRKIRQALEDDPESPRFVLTVQGRGYRFVAPVQKIRPESSSEIKDPQPPLTTARVRKWHTRIVITAAVFLAAIAVAAFFHFHRAQALSEKDTIVLGDIANHTGDAVFDDTLKQALSVELSQSPFLKILSDEKISQAMRMMGHPGDGRITEKTALEICRRSQSTVVLVGSIDTVGHEYVIGLNLLACRTGDLLAQEQLNANRKEDVLKAVDRAAVKLRDKLGESRGMIEKFDIPVEQATTPSLEALQAYSLGCRKLMGGNMPAAVSAFQQAIQLDPNFAMAYAILGSTYSNLGELELAEDSTRRAFALRERVSERERFYIDSHYHMFVTGSVEKGREVLELWEQAYPRDEVPVFNLGALYGNIGQFDKALQEGQAAVRLDPNSSLSHATLAYYYLVLNRYAEAQATINEARAKNLDSPALHMASYQLAFEQNDSAGMQRELAWSTGKSGIENSLLASEAGAAAYVGRLQAARELSRRAMLSAQQAEQEEAAVNYLASSALRESLFGNMEEARRRAKTVLTETKSEEILFQVSLALAIAGDTTDAGIVAGKLAASHPEDSFAKYVYLPTIQAQISLEKGNSANALQELEAAASYELGDEGRLYPIYVRGESYLTARRGREAVAEFQKIMDNRGAVFMEPIGALARLGLGRAYALEREKAKARARYVDFFTLWKNADPDIPILKQAKAEYAKLQ
jgi:DNA-binding winged helix-turn-helix (wHTH) protein/Flp pilus assembly protein TadD